jgi:hypothetical protein
MEYQQLSAAGSAVEVVMFRASPTAQSNSGSLPEGTLTVPLSEAGVSTVNFAVVADLKVTV